MVENQLWVVRNSMELLTLFASVIMISFALSIISRGKSPKKYTYTQVKETRTQRQNTAVASVVYWRFSTGLTYILAKFNTSANQVTILSFLFAILAALIFVVGDYPTIIWGGILTLFLFILDMVDGEIARLKGEASTFGLWVDHIFGEASQILVYVGIALGILLTNADLQNVLLTVVFLFGCVMNYSVFIETRALLEVYPKQALEGKLANASRILGVRPSDLSLTGDVVATLILVFAVVNQLSFLVLFLAIVFNIQWVSAFILIYRQKAKENDKQTRVSLNAQPTAS